MISRAARVIYRKEMLDTLRDRRTLASMFLVPMVLYPLSVILTSQAIESETIARDERTVRVLVDGRVPADVRAALARLPKFAIETSTPAAMDPSSTGARELFRSRPELDLIVASETSSAPARATADFGTTDLLLVYESTRPHGESAVQRVEERLLQAATDIRDARLARLGVPPSTAQPLTWTRRSVSTRAEMGNHAVASVLPSLILLFIAVSAFYPAVDLTAGEKERRTLGTLLSAPVAAVDLVTGKYLTVLTVGTLAGLGNVAVLILTLLRIIADAQRAGSGPAISVSFGMLLGLIGGVVLVAMPVAALMLLFGTISRSFRDASTLLSPVLLLVMIPAIFSAFPSSELTATSALVPLANAGLLMKALVLGQAAVGTAVIATLSSLLFTSALLLFSARTFGDERVLFSSEGRRADLRSLLFAPPPAGASTALAFAGTCFVITYYSGLLVPARSPLSAVIVTQLLAYLVPAMALARWLRPKLPTIELLRARVPSARGLVAGLLIGLGAWLSVSVPIAWLMDVLVAGQEAAGEALAEALGLRGLNLAVAILVFAVLPAVSEELAFRGALMTLLSRTIRPSSAVVFQALLFGLMHASIHRLLPTGALGLLLGLLALRTGSIWPGVVAHGLTNAILIVVDRQASGPFRAASLTAVPYVFVAAISVALGLLLLRSGHDSCGQNGGNRLPTAGES